MYKLLLVLFACIVLFWIYIQVKKYKQKKEVEEYKNHDEIKINYKTFELDDNSINNILDEINFI